MTNRRGRERQRRRLRVSLGKVALFTSDVSDGGFCVELMHVLDPGSDASGQIWIGSHEYPFLGKVAWAYAGDPLLGKRGRMGVRFTGVDVHFVMAFREAFPAGGPGSSGAARPGQPVAHRPAGGFQR